MPSRNRVDWVDVLKGMAIVLVVLYHSAHIALPLGFAASWWRELDELLSSFRMPAFFFASGLFARSVIQRPWGKFWSSRIALLVWVFVVWTLIRYAYFWVAPLETRPFETDIKALIMAPVWPSSGLWFLHALAFFFVLAKLFSRVPAWMQIAFAFGVSVASYGPFHVGNLSYDGMAHYFIFFVLALHLRDVVILITSRRRILLAIMFMLIFAVMSYAAAATRIGNIPGVHSAVGVSAVLAGVLIARVLQDSPFCAFLAYLGKNTLPIYVQHVLLICAIYSTILAMDIPMSSGVVLVVEPVVVATVVIAASLFVHAMAMRFSWTRSLFTAPRWMTGRRDLTTNI